MNNSVYTMEMWDKGMVNAKKAGLSPWKRPQKPSPVSQSSVSTGTVRDEMSTGTVRDDNYC